MRWPRACRGAASSVAIESDDRSPYQRDRDRVVHCSAFRKLQYKTQVFVTREGDFYRTRLTHSLEVAQIARSIARKLGLDEDLTEALALAHDLGHPPFGHAGETGLNEALAAFGGFDHNAQSLRVVTLLEQRYANFDGLNLSWEALEGLAKHNGPLTAPPDYIAAFDAGYSLDLHRQPSPRRRWPPSPTISPITPTTWMTGCAPGCSVLRRLRICRWSATRCGGAA